MRLMRMCTIVAALILVLLSLACSRTVPRQILPTVSPTHTAAPPTRTSIPSDAAPSLSETPLPSPTTPVPTVTPTAVTATPIPAMPGPGGVLWRAGGKDVFTILGGMDTGGERVYVADAYRGVLVFDLQGNAQGVISPGEIGYVIDVKVGPTGIIYMADMAFHQISMFDANGDLLGAFGGSGSGDGEFGTNSPRALAVSPLGEVFVLDPNLNAEGREIMRVQVFDADGGFLHSFMIGPGHDEQAMAFSPNDTLLVLSQEGSVAEFIPEDGLLMHKLDLEALRGRLPQTLGVDGDGNLYVTTQVPAAVAVLNSSWQFVEWLGEEGVRTEEGWPVGEFLFPFGVAVADDGNYVFVGDTFESFAYVTAFERKE